MSIKEQRSERIRNLLEQKPSWIITKGIWIVIVAFVIITIIAYLVLL